jgi:hypothetical protein
MSLPRGTTGLKAAAAAAAVIEVLSDALQELVTRHKGLNQQPQQVSKLLLLLDAHEPSNCAKMPSLRAHKEH